MHQAEDVRQFSAEKRAQVELDLDAPDGVIPLPAWTPKLLLIEKEIRAVVNTPAALAAGRRSLADK